MLHIPFISISLHFTFITWARILLYMGIHVLYTQFYPFSDLFFNFTSFYVPLRVLYNFCKLVNSQTHPNSPWIRFVFWNMQKKNCTITPILQFCYNGLCAAILHFSFISLWFFIIPSKRLCHDFHTHSISSFIRDSPNLWLLSYLLYLPTRIKIPSLFLHFSNTLLLCLLHLWISLFLRCFQRLKIFQRFLFLLSL